MIKLLLDLGADVNSTNKYGRTPLHDAALRSNFKRIKLEIQAECSNFFVSLLKAIVKV